MTAFAFNIDVPVRAEWKNVSLLVTSVQNCFNAVFANVDGSQTIAMVTGELLENAIKYGSWDNSSQQFFRLNVTGRDRLARVVVENPGDDASIAELMKTLAWLKGFEQPEDAYRAKLLEIAQLSRTVGESKLGLVRIAYEGACSLAASVANGLVRVTANLKL